MLTDPWLWHRSRQGGRVHGYPRDDYDRNVSLCAKVVTDHLPIPTEHDPIDRCGLCVRRAKEAAR